MMFRRAIEARHSVAALLILLLLQIRAAVPPDRAAEAQSELFAARYKHAAELYRDLLKQDPDWAPGYYGLVRALLEDEHAHQAYQVAEDGLKRLPKTAEALTAAGFASFRHGEIQKAEQYFIQARQINPQYPGALEGLADIYACVSRFKTALDLRLAAFAKQPDNPALITAWANTLKGKEHIEGLQRALSIYDPSSREARSLRAHIASDKALGDRKVRQLASPYQQYAIKLIRIEPTPGKPRGLGIQAKLNGRRTISLLLDTGASGISISPRAAAKAGLEALGEETVESRGVGDDKPPDESRFLASSLEIAGLAFNNYVVSAFRSAKDDDIDGLIGADVFRQFLVTIDFPNAKLLLEPFPGPPPGEEPEDAPPLPSGSFRAIRSSSHLMVFTAVNESAGHLFLLDSGFFTNVIDTALASEVTKVHADDRLGIRGIQGRVKEVSRADRITLTFAGFRQVNANLVAMNLDKIGDGLNIGIDGIIGMSVMWNVKMTIDYRTGAVRLVHPM